MTECGACGGIGWLRYDAPVGDPNFGRVVVCSGEVHANEAARLRAAGLKPHEGYTLDDILPLSGVTVKLVEVMCGFLERPRGWLYLWGGPGNGKTLALMAAVNEFASRGESALYITMADLLDLMRETFKRPGQGRGSADGEDQWRKWDTYQARFRRVQDVKLLAVDEFDASKINETGFVREFRARLIDHRYRSAIAEQTYTLFAGNENPAALPGWVWDRVRDGRFTVWRNAGESVRPVMSWSD